MGEQRVIVSGGDALRVYAQLQRDSCAQVRLEGAGALCAGNEAVFAACDQGDMIWRLDAAALTPTGLFAGGPGMCRLLLSKDGTRLYALCKDADSLLMLDAHSGTPLVLCRVGAAPCAMEMDDGGEIIAVAGGASGEIVLLDAQTLQVIAHTMTCGMVLSVSLKGRMAYALSMSEAMDSVLTGIAPPGRVWQKRLPGLPGALAMHAHGVTAATHDRIYMVSFDGRRACCTGEAPGCAARMIALSGGMLLCDTWSDTLFWKENRRARWHALAHDARDMVVAP